MSSEANRMKTQCTHSSDIIGTVIFDGFVQLCFMQRTRLIFIVSPWYKQILMELDVFWGICNHKWYCEASRKGKFNLKVTHGNQNRQKGISYCRNLHGTMALWRKLLSNIVNKHALRSIVRCKMSANFLFIGRESHCFAMSGNYFVSLLGRQWKVCVTRQSGVKICK